MKSLLLSCLMASSPLWAAAPDPGVSAPAEHAEPTEEKEFRDPFATPTEKGATKQAIADPFQKVNRAFFTFNDKLYFWVLKPAAKGYNKVAPEPFRQSMRRLFINARYPVRVVNNLLQGRLKGAGIETTRFLVNSTLGIGGLFDPAKDEWNIQPRPQDLDATLEFYRLPMGPYLVWPLLGSSSVRNTVGMVGDGFLSPWPYVDGIAVIYGVRVFDTVNSTSLRLGEYESLKQAALDPYVALREAFAENRRSLIQQWRGKEAPPSEEN